MGTVFIALNNSKKTSKRSKRSSSSRPSVSLCSFPLLSFVTILFFVVSLVFSAVLKKQVGKRKYNRLFSKIMTANHHAGAIFDTVDSIPDDVLLHLDAIFILGGGKPLSVSEPPLYVQQRCDDAVSLLSKRHSLEQNYSKSLSTDEPSSASESVPILCLSAGTAHMPQLIGGNGLPVWESVASAAYLQHKYPHLDASNIFVETTSYDTIGNAFFARTGFTEVVGWRRLLIITNEFHLARSKAIFDWIFGIPNNVPETSRQPYELYYFQSPNTGLTQLALESRRQRENASLASVQKLSQIHTSTSAVWSFLNTQHDLYTARKLVDRGVAPSSETRSSSSVDALLKLSYGAT